MNSKRHRHNHKLIVKYVEATGLSKDETAQEEPYVKFRVPGWEGAYESVIAL